MKHILLISCFSLLVACGQKNTGQQAGAQNDIFDRGNVDRLMKENAGQKAEADKLYVLGEKQLRKDKQPAGAIVSFTRSLNAYPTAKGYFELGNAYMDAKQYTEAIRAYNMAEAMDYKPLSKVLYNTACAYSVNNSSYEAGRYLEYAIESGYNNPGHITTDKDLTSPEYGFAYDDDFLDAMSGSTDEAEILWSNFKKAFVAMAMPFVIDRTTDKKLSGHHTLSNRFSKYVPEMHSKARFSRMGGPSYYDYAFIARNNNYVTVIYATQDEVDGDYYPANYWMVSYSPTGDQIDKINIAGQMGASQVSKVFTINEDLTFQVKEFNNEYEKSLEQNGLYDNKVVKSALIATREYRINDQGKFIEEGPRLGMK